MTSTCCPLTRLEFPQALRNWKETSIEELFSAKLVKVPLEHAKSVIHQLSDLAKVSTEVEIWADTDPTSDLLA